MKKFAPKLFALIFALTFSCLFFACEKPGKQDVIYTVTVQQSEGGTITYECADQKIVTGSRIIVLLQAAEHYETDGLFVNGERKIPDASGKFIIVVQNENIVLWQNSKKRIILS